MFWTSFSVNYFSAADEVPASSSDVPFGFPVMGVAREGVATTTDEWRLIQTGQMTPFGTSVDTPSADSALSVGEHTSDETSRAPRASAESASSKQPTVQLSSDSFGGLFTNGGLEAPGKRRIARIPKKKKKTEASSEQDHNDTSKSALLEPDTKNGNEPAVVSNSHTTEAAPAEPDDWIPSLTDLLESDSVSNESEYYTDEELGESQEAKKRKKRKRLRPLSDDDFSDESEGGLPRSKRKRAGSRKTTRHGDDGDKNLYRQRLKSVSSSLPSSLPYSLFSPSLPPLLSSSLSLAPSFLLIPPSFLYLPLPLPPSPLPLPPPSPPPLLYVL